MGRATVAALATMLLGFVIGSILLGLGLNALGTVAICAGFVVAFGVWIVKATEI